MSRAWVAAGLLLLAGCSSGDAASSNESSPDESRAPPLWSADGLEAQPRLDAYRASLPADLGYEPGTTGWQAPHQALPARLGADGERQPSPGALLQALVDELDLAASLGLDLWEQTQRIHLDGDSAIGVVLQWGLKDDAVQGQDYRLTMREDAGGWYAEHLETRYHCGRGVSGDLCR